MLVVHGGDESRTNQNFQHLKLTEKIHKSDILSSQKKVPREKYIWNQIIHRISAGNNWKGVKVENT